MMRRGRQSLAMAALVGLGYLLGSSELLKMPIGWAQDDGASLSDEATKKVQTAYDAMKSAMDILKTEGQYKAVTKGVNGYAVLAGGLDVERDLEEGKGVDPETFAALYAGDAIESVAEHLSRDEEGRLTYKNKVVRIYPISRLKKVHAHRQELTGEVAPTSSKKKK